jgi:hypothetical protein
MQKRVQEESKKLSYIQRSRTPDSAQYFSLYVGKICNENFRERIENAVKNLSNVVRNLSMQ